VSAAADGQMARRLVARLRESLSRPVLLLLGGMGAPANRSDTVTVASFVELDRWARELRATSFVPQTGQR